MGDITKNLSRHEFACQCGCGFVDPHPELVHGLQYLREYLGVSVSITSGCRCTAHNAVVGGGERSQHLPGPAGYGRAADLMAAVPLLDLYTAACAVPAFARGGVGLYFDSGGPRVHVDVRNRKVRWGMLHGEKATAMKVLAAAT